MPFSFAIKRLSTPDAQFCPGWSEALPLAPLRSARGRQCGTQGGYEQKVLGYTGQTKVAKRHKNTFEVQLSYVSAALGGSQHTALVFARAR